MCSDGGLGRDLGQLDDVIDLVIPRGSNKLVSQIKASTKIPVLGHADGVCHVYIDKSADMYMAKYIVLDEKIDYPAACIAMNQMLEMVLICRSILGLSSCQRLISLFLIPEGTKSKFVIC